MRQEAPELTKKDTKMMQGLAILAMVTLHLFDTLNYQGKFVPLIQLFGYPLVIYFAQLSDFCVMAFAFCSGYAHMTQYGKPQYFKRRLVGLLGVYLNFWIILILFSGISMIVGNGATIPKDFLTFLGNFTTFRLTYNGAWWYLFTYALITLASPILLRLSRHTSIWKTIVVILFAGILYCGSYYVRFKVDSDNWFLYQFGLFGMTAVEYMMGSLAHEYQVFRRIGNIWDKLFRSTWVNILVSITIFAILLWSRTKLIPALFFAPLSGTILLFLFWKNKKPKWFEKSFLFLGEQSTNIWLTHMFFYATVFTGLVYLAKYPILILLFMFAITITVSLLINLAFRPLWKQVKKRLLKE